MAVSAVSSARYSSQTSASTPILRQGASGASVRTLQQLLRSKGINVAVDGSFGPKTAAALKQFQASQGLAADGVCGPKTWAALKATAASSAPKSSGSPVLKQGAKGAAVVEMQKLLAGKGYRLSADGSFGPATANALKQFQRARGLVADGVCGPKTWQALRGAGGTAPTGGGTPAGSKTVTGYVSGRKTTVTVAPVGGGEYLNVRCAQAYKDMLAAARKAGINLSTTDGYRTYDEQAALYRRYGSGRAARPGYSNHQMGLSVDIGGVGGYNTRAYRWLKANAGRFGFVNDVRGEHWHWTFKK